MIKIKLFEDVPREMRPWFIAGAKARLKGKSLQTCLMKVKLMGKIENIVNPQGLLVASLDDATLQILGYFQYGYRMGILPEKIRKMEQALLPDYYKR